MRVEAVVSLAADWNSHSPALFAFGGDSLVELLSAAVVFWRFWFELNEGRAARIAGAFLFMLAGLVALTSVLLLLIGGVYFYFASGMAPVATADEPMPYEKKMASISKNAHIRKQMIPPPPLPPDEPNLVAGAKGCTRNSARPVTACPISPRP
jgi:hypothetical protein